VPATNLPAVQTGCIQTRPPLRARYGGSCIGKRPPVQWQVEQVVGDCEFPPPKLDVCSGVLINQLFCSGEQSNLAHYSLSAKPWETLRPSSRTRRCRAHRPSFKFKLVRTQSSQRNASSALRAFFSISSRSRPGGRWEAFSRASSANAASRSFSETGCMIRRHLSTSTHRVW
jgi:hypothetical protein